MTSATTQGFMKKSLEIPRAKTTSDVNSAVQMLEDLVRKHEEHRDKKYDNDLRLQRFCDTLPKPIEQQLVLEDRYGSATYESVKRRGNNWIMMNSTKRADMDLGTMGNGDNEDNDGGQEGDSSGDLRGNKERYSTTDTVTSVDSGDARPRIASRQQQFATTVGSGDMWQRRALKKEKGSKGSKNREEARENTGKGKGKNRQMLVVESGVPILSITQDFAEHICLPTDRENWYDKDFADPIDPTEDFSEDDHMAAAGSMTSSYGIRG